MDYISRLIIEGNLFFQTKIAFLTFIFISSIIYFLNLDMRNPVNIIVVSLFVYYFLNIYLQKEYNNTSDFNRLTKYKLQKLRELHKRFVTEKLNKTKFTKKEDRQKIIKLEMEKLNWLYIDVNFIHFMESISYFYDQNKEAYISLLKCIGNILKLRWQSEELLNQKSDLDVGVKSRTLYSNFEETERLSDLTLNHFNSLIHTIPKSNSSYQFHQKLLTRLHLLLLRSIDIQRSYYTTFTENSKLTTSTQILPNKNIFTKPINFQTELPAQFKIYGV